MSKASYLPDISSRFAAIALILAAFAVPGFANQFSFIGTFAHDNEVQLFAFQMLQADTVTLQTWSYGGGFNTRGDLINAGGFVPVLQIYDAGTGEANPVTF